MEMISDSVCYGYRYECKLAAPGSAEGRALLHAAIP